MHWFGPLPGSREARALSWIMIVAALIVCGLSIVRGFQGQTLMGRPLGGDFVQFYVAGKILNQYEPARMYDLDLEVRLQRSLRGTYLSPLCPAPLPLGECRLARFLAGSLLSRGRFVASISRAFRAAEENRFSAGDILNAVPHGELDRRADFRTRFHCGHAVCVFPRQESQVFRWSRACAGAVQADTHRDPGSDAVLRPALAHAGRGYNRGSRARAGFDSNGGNQRVRCVARHSEVLRASGNRSSGSAAPQTWMWVRFFICC